MSSKYQEVEDFLTYFTVSRETEQRLITYFTTLKKWNKKINLVSEKTIESSWQRHFVDSAQIINLLPKNTKTIADLGCGAGFPGMVLSIIKADFDFCFETYLIESDAKKCAFLQEISRVCKVEKVKIINKRIEEVKDIKVNIVVARALAKLNILLDYSYNYITECSSCLFLKTQNIEDEILEAQKKWVFNYTLKPSISDKTGTIIILENIKNAQA